jgi:hypothetical protein
MATLKPEEDPEIAPEMPLLGSILTDAAALLVEPERQAKAMHGPVPSARHGAKL